jgi:hypothetical protein
LTLAAESRAALVRAWNDLRAHVHAAHFDACVALAKVDRVAEEVAVDEAVREIQRAKAALARAQQILKLKEGSLFPGFPRKHRRS